MVRVRFLSELEAAEEKRRLRITKCRIRKDQNRSAWLKTPLTLLRCYKPLLFLPPTPCRLLTLLPGQSITHRVSEDHWEERPQSEK